MADNNSGDKTEKPTPKKIRDARKKGNVAKSKDLSSTIVFILWVILYIFLLRYTADRLAYLMDAVVTTPGADFITTAKSLGRYAMTTLLIISAIFMIPIAFFGTLVEFLQVGPVLTFEKIKPKLDNMNPVSGMKKMFSTDNLVEVFKHILKTSLLFVIAWVVIKSAMPDLLKLPTATPAHTGSMMWNVFFKLAAWIIGIFSLIAIADVMYQRYSWTKKLRMSQRDIKQEFKESEGDPMIKQKRKESHQEWSEQSAAEAAGSANVLVVNPTHIAIAINHDREDTPVPIVSAKGKDHIAKAMREAAEEAHVPILRNVPLARELLRKCDEGDIVPRDLFDIIAEVILWSEAVRNEGDSSKDDNKQPAPPGEDLTRHHNYNRVTGKPAN